MLEERALEAPWRDLDRDLRLAAAAIEARFGGPLDAAGAEAVQVVRPVFFRNKGRLRRRPRARSRRRVAARARPHPSRPGGGGGRRRARADEVQPGVQLHPLLLPVDVRSRPELVAFPEVDHAPQAGGGALHLDRPQQARQDRVLPRAASVTSPTPTIASRSPRRPRHGDGGLHAALVDVVFKIIRDRFAPQDVTRAGGHGSTGSSSVTTAPADWWTPRSSSTSSSTASASLPSCSTNSCRCARHGSAAGRRTW